MPSDERCERCGGDCAPECGRHPLGCIYGGFTTKTAYWLAVDECKLNHGEFKPKREEGDE